MRYFSLTLALGLALGAAGPVVAQQLKAGVLSCDVSSARRMFSVVLLSDHPPCRGQHKRKKSKHADKPRLVSSVNAPIG